MTRKCAECADLLNELVSAMQSDREHLKESWIASGRDLVELRDKMLSSLANDETHESFGPGSPRALEVKRKMAEHQARTGHSLFNLR